MYSACEPRTDDGDFCDFAVLLYSINWKRAASNKKLVARIIILIPPFPKPPLDLKKPDNYLPQKPLKIFLHHSMKLVEI
jgi:hypothetical protein